MALDGGSDLSRVATASATIVVCLIPVAWRLGRRRFDIFEPIVFSSAMLVMLFGARPLWIEATGEHFWLSGNVDVEPWLGAAYFGGLVGCLAFVVGYEVATARWGRSAPQRAPAHTTSGGPERRLVVLVAILMGAAGIILWVLSLQAAGSISRGLDLALGGRSAESQAALTSSEYLTSAPILGACGALLLVLTGPGWRSRRELVLIVALAAIPCVIFALGGGRRFIIPSLAIPLVAFALIRDWRPTRRLVAVGLPVLCFLLLLVPILRSQDARENSGGFLPAVGATLRDPGEPVRNFLSGTDSENVVVFAMEISLLRESADYARGGATLGDVLIAPIPSKVFPNKPVTARDSLLKKMTGSVCDPAGAGCPDYGAVGSFYHDFGVPTLLLGMALLGFSSSALWGLWKRTSGSPFVILLASSWTVMLPILLRAGWMPGFAWWLFFVVPTALALWGLTLWRRAPPVGNLRRAGARS